MNVEVIQRAWKIARASGEIDYSNVKPFITALEEAARESPRGVIIDLSGVTYVDSAGIQAILGVYKPLTNAGGCLAVVNTHPNMKEILGIVNLDRLPRLFMCDSLEEAEQALAKATESNET